MIDLRSDTVTKPTPEMLEIMSRVEVGDDVFGEDPAANKFQQKMADYFGFEAGLFVPSGVMANQLSLNVLTRPGDEVILEEKSHIFNYENTAAALLSSVQLRPLKGSHGKLNVTQIRESVRGRFEWEPRTRLIVLENSTNKGGGVCYRQEELEAIDKFRRDYGLHLHVDGARIWNAITAVDITPSFFGSLADTMSICFSKGLGAPVGSMILSDRERIKEARRMRKMIGGGMRQVGLLAAAADYAVDHHFQYLALDHIRAKKLAETVDECRRLSIDKDSVETNIVIFYVKEGTAVQALEKLEKEGIRMVPFGPKTIRATFHFQVDDQQLEKTRKTLLRLFG